MQVGRHPELANGLMTMVRQKPCGEGKGKIQADHEPVIHGRPLREELSYFRSAASVLKEYELRVNDFRDPYPLARA
jgi:hypothetical protein